MTDAFHSCEITPIGISIKVLRDGTGHRSAIGVGDYKSRDSYKNAVEALLSPHLGNNFAAIIARASAAEQMIADAEIEKTKALAEADAAKASALADVEKVQADAIAALQAADKANAAAIADRDAAIEAKAQAERERDALGTKPEAQALMRELRKAELEEQQKAIAAELTSLTAPIGRRAP